MAVNSQLEIFKFALPKSSGDFGNLIHKKFFPDNVEKPSDNELFKKIYKEFLRPLSTNEIWQFDEKKKGLTVFQNQGQEINTIITSHFESKVIEGFIDGGRYDMIRNLSNLTNKNQTTLISANDIVSARYYFYLYIPLNKNISILFLEKKGDEQIRDAMQEYLKKLFLYINACHVECYYPESFIQRFKDSAVVDSIYCIDYYSSQVGNDDRVLAEKYEISIQIKNIGKKVPYEDLEQLRQKFNGASLSWDNFAKQFLNFSKHKVVLKNTETNQTATYDIDNVEKIRPCIQIDQNWIENGRLNRIQIKGLCENVLDNIKDVIYAE